MALKLIYDPAVYLVGRQEIDEAALSRFLADEAAEGWRTDTEEAGQILVEISGRLCYKSYARPRPGGNKAYIDHILESKHGSVIEHCVFNFIITGVSRSLTHELVRHRAGFGYSQRSQRFCEEDDAAFVIPDDYREEVDLAIKFLEHSLTVSWQDKPLAAVERALDSGQTVGNDRLYYGLLWLRNMLRNQADYAALSGWGMAKFAAVEDRTDRRKRARGAARSVLPNATETQIFVTVNARAARHFLEMRGDPAAEVEIRKVAVAMADRLKSEAPNIFRDVVIDYTAKSVSLTHRKV